MAKRKSPLDRDFIDLYGLMLHVDPYRFLELLWPHVNLYNKQWEIVFSVDHNDETFVPAGNQLGKDFVAAFIILRYFLLNAQEPGGCRVVTTSVKDDHLRVLWGELGRFLKSSQRPLLYKYGGAIIAKHNELRWVDKNTDLIDTINYVRGMVSEKGEGMAGHHAAYTLAVIDEASGVDDLVYNQIRSWAKRILVIGNTMPTTNFFYRAVKQGDIKVGQKLDPLTVSD